MITKEQIIHNSIIILFVIAIFLVALIGGNKINNAQAQKDEEYPPLITSKITGKENQSADDFLLNLTNNDYLYVNKNIYEKSHIDDTICWINYRQKTPEFKNFGNCEVPKGKP